MSKPGVDRATQIRCPYCDTPKIIAGLDFNRTLKYFGATECDLQTGCGGLFAYRIEAHISSDVYRTSEGG